MQQSQLTRRQLVYQSCLVLSVNYHISLLDGYYPKKKNINTIAHREGRTRSLQMPWPSFSLKSLTLYPIELGGHMIYGMYKQLRPWCFC